MRTRAHGRSEHGAVVVMVAIWLPVLALFASFAVDIGHFYDYSRNLQNRADAAALAAGDQYGGICFGSPTASDMTPIGQMGQLFSGPPGSSSDLPYPYSGAGSPLQAFPQYPWASQYQNIPNLTVGSAQNGAHYHVLLNAQDYYPNGTNFSLGTFCNSDPTLDQTDRVCYGAAKPTGTCVAGPMVDVKVTQDNLPLFFPLLGIRPTISAHARVTVEGLKTATHIRPLAVGDAAYVPCVRVKFFPAGSSTATTTIQLTLNKNATKNAGNPVWDNSTDNANTGDAVQMATTGQGYVYMQAMLYSQGTSGNCDTVRNSITYPLSSSGSSTTDGILDLNAYPSTSLGTLPSGSAPRIDTNGVTLSQGTGNPDQYFSSSGDYKVDVTANVAFSSNAGTTQVWAVDTNTGQMLQLTQQGTTNTWTGSGLSASALSGQHPICIQVSQTGGLTSSQKSTCPTVSGSPAGGGIYYSLGVQQQTFAACNEAQDACSNDESGPIISAVISQSSGNSTIGAFPAGTSPSLIVSLEFQGLSDATPYDPTTDTGDLCSPPPGSTATADCTVLRLNNAGNGNGAIDCGEGNGASFFAATLLYGCPIYGKTPPAPAVSCKATSTSVVYCGTWTPTVDGSCNNVPTRPAGAVTCVNTNVDGSQVPSCVAALIQTGATVNSTNCNLQGASTGCAVDHWLQGDKIPPGDPRLMSTFIVFSGDYINATGNTPVPIRKFAAFYVTGWKYQGKMVTCPTGLDPTQANEDPPAAAKSANNAIWGHWVTYTVPGEGNGKVCNFQDFGECTAVLSR